MTAEEIKEEIKYRIKIMAAYANGEAVEFQNKDKFFEMYNMTESNWTSLNKISESSDNLFPAFNFSKVCYRIKPTPRKLWVAMSKSDKNKMYGADDDKTRLEEYCENLFLSDVEIVPFTEDIV